MKSTLSNMIKSYTSNMKLQGRLKVNIKFVENGTKMSFKKGQLSELLIKKSDDTYYFEADNSAITVTKDEIEIL